MKPKLLTKIKEVALELLFPIKCAACEKETAGKRKNKLICTDCLKKLSPSLNFYCPLCEARVANGELCFSCRLLISNTENKFYLDRLLYPFSYKDPAIQKIIQAFKYRFIKSLDEPIGKLIANYLNKIMEQFNLEDYSIVPVPLHKRKYNQRGYNQSELIAQKISPTNTNQLVSICLVKRRATKDQAKLKENKRLRNLKDAFFCPKPWLVAGRRILLVDDVYTTGTTMAECAKVLKESGAKEVVGLAIARG